MSPIFARAAFSYAVASSTFGSASVCQFMSRYEAAVYSTVAMAGERRRCMNSRAAGKTTPKYKSCLNNSREEELESEIEELEDDDDFAIADGGGDGPTT